MPISLRTEKTFQKYLKFIEDGFLADGCNLCKKETIIKEFKYWVIIDNKFPWDKIAKVSHLIIPKRHVLYEELNNDEKKEFDIIKSTYIEKEYELIAEVTNNNKSIPEHLHIHLMITKDED